MVVGGGSGLVPGISRRVRKTHSASPSGRAAEGLIRAGHPSEWSRSPTGWNIGHCARDGVIGGSPTRAKRFWSERSATVGKLISHRHRSRGNPCRGGRPASARKRYHSAHAVSGLSAK